MKASTRGMLLSGLVYPGLGQLILGRWISGIVLVLFATVTFVVLIYRVVERVYRLADQILPLLAENALDVETFKELLARDAAGGWGVEKICLVGLAVVWLVAIGHAYVAGKEIDSQSLSKKG
jgi:TM2 domain-containing membrane protein YozV